MISADEPTYLNMTADLSPAGSSTLTLSPSLSQPSSSEDETTTSASNCDLVEDKSKPGITRTMILASMWKHRFMTMSTVVNQFQSGIQLKSSDQIIAHLQSSPDLQTSKSIHKPDILEVRRRIKKTKLAASVLKCSKISIPPDKPQPQPVPVEKRKPANNQHPIPRDVELKTQLLKRHFDILNSEIIEDFTLQLSESPKIYFCTPDVARKRTEMKSLSQLVSRLRVQSHFISEGTQTSFESLTVKPVDSTSQEFPLVPRRTLVSETRRKEIERLSPVSYMNKNVHMVTADPGLRLLNTVKVGDTDSEQQREKHKVRSIPGRLGIETPNEKCGETNYGILHMGWTTDDPRDTVSLHPDKQSNYSELVEHPLPSVKRKRSVVQVLPPVGRGGNLVQKPAMLKRKCHSFFKSDSDYIIAVHNGRRYKQTCAVPRSLRDVTIQPLRLREVVQLVQQTGRQMYGQTRPYLHSLNKQDVCACF